MDSYLAAADAEDVSTMADRSLFKNEVLAPIRLRVLTVLSFWLDHHFTDFEDDKEMLTFLREFLEWQKDSISPIAYKKLTDVIVRQTSAKV